MHLGAEEEEEKKSNSSMQHVGKIHLTAFISQHHKETKKRVKNICFDANFIEFHFF